VLMLNRPIIAMDVWDEEAMSRRGVSLFDTALQIWPRPVGPQANVTEPSATRGVGPSRTTVPMVASVEQAARVRPGTELAGEFARRSFTKALIEDLIAEFRLDEALFRRIHHYGPNRYQNHSLLKDHLSYCDRAAFFSEEGTNVGTARRLAVCLARLRAGATWEEALRDARERFPVPGA
jgi:hypothetical protein